MTVKELYSSYEEYAPFIVDRFERRPSFLSLNPNKLQPVLSNHLFNNGFRPIYKDNKKYAICLTHDIDYLYEHETTRMRVMNSLRALDRKDTDKFFYYLKNLVRLKMNPDWVLDKFIDLEARYGLPATYYFLALQPGELDFNYHAESIKSYFSRIEEIGGEVGLHGGHEAFKSLKKLQSEKQLLENAAGKTIQGYRNHYLRFKTPDTWEYLEKLGFIYDTTFGYADLTGYRNGLCYPYRPFNINTNAYMDIVELPLIVMDVSFWKYMGLNSENSFVLFKKIAKDVKDVNGVLTILWHNNNLTGEPGNLFNKILDYIRKEEDAWIANSKELVLFWKEKNLPAMEEMLQPSFDKKLYSIM